MRPELTVVGLLPERKGDKPQVGSWYLTFKLRDERDLGKLYTAMVQWGPGIIFYVREPIMWSSLDFEVDMLRTGIEYITDMVANTPLNAWF